MTTGREYLRVSFDRSGHQRSNDEQHTDNLAAAAALGIENLGEPYRDVGSASKHARKKRDDFDRLLADLASGRFGADVLVLWESSRGSRKVGDWVTVLDLCEKAGVKIMVTTHHRIYEPGNARDRRSVLEDAVDSEYESSKIRDRTKRSAAATAVAGLPHGRIPYGYRRIYDPLTRKLIAQEPDPKEAPIVVEMFDRVASGHSLAAICKDFTSRGIKSRQGVPFTAQTIRGLLLSATYRGKRAHSPGKRVRGHDAEFTYDAQWPALVPDALFLAVRDRLKDPSRTTTRPGRAKHLLSMLARCDHCGGAMVSTDRLGLRRYQCQTSGHSTVPADELDDWAEAKVIALLTRPDVVERLLPQPVNAKAVADARDELARVRGEHRDLIAEVAAGKLSAAMAAGAEPVILGRVKQAEAKVRELATPPALRNLIEPGPLVAQHWQAMPMSSKREAMALLFRPGVLGLLSVARANGDRSVLGRVRLDGAVLR